MRVRSRIPMLLVLILLAIVASGCATPLNTVDPPSAVPVKEKVVVPAEEKSRLAKVVQDLRDLSPSSGEKRDGVMYGNAVLKASDYLDGVNPSTPESTKVKELLARAIAEHQAVVDTVGASEYLAYEKQYLAAAETAQKYVDEANALMDGWAR